MPPYWVPVEGDARDPALRAALGRWANLEELGDRPPLRTGRFHLLVRNVYSAEEAEEMVALCISTAGTRHSVGKAHRAQSAV